MNAISQIAVDVSLTTRDGRCYPLASWMDVAGSVALIQGAAEGKRLVTFLSYRGWFCAEVTPANVNAAIVHARRYTDWLDVVARPLSPDARIYARCVDAASLWLVKTVFGGSANVDDKEMECAQ